LLKHGAALSAVVKANAYGHGAVEVARACLSAGASRLAVVSVPQGIELREAGIRAPIQLLGPCTPEELAPGIEHGLIFAVSSVDEIAALADRTRAAHQGPYRGRTTRVHLLVDTGMGRGGFAPEDLWPAAERIKTERTLELEGAFTHFSSAEEPDPAPTREQVSLFRCLLNGLVERGVRVPIRHAANSAATVFFPETQLDMVRCGAILHGLRGWDSARDTVPLRPALSLYCRIVNIGKRAAGWPVGYNRTYICRRETQLATLSIGYSHGYRRSLSGRGEVLVRGRRCPVIGTISMDYIVADVTALANGPQGLPEVGEEVTLIGSSEDGSERITVEQVAANSGTIPYVITTQLDPTVERVFVGGITDLQTVDRDMDLRHEEPETSARILPLRPVVTQKASGA
jgi:alanine racemase